MDKEHFNFDADKTDYDIAKIIGKMFPSSDGFQCEQRSAAPHFICTLPDDHEGFHVAHSTDNLACAIWR